MYTCVFDSITIFFFFSYCDKSECVTVAIPGLSFWCFFLLLLLLLPCFTFLWTDDTMELVWLIFFLSCWAYTRCSKSTRCNRHCWWNQKNFFFRKRKYIWTEIWKKKNQFISVCIIDAQLNCENMIGWNKCVNHSWITS